MAAIATTGVDTPIADTEASSVADTQKRDLSALNYLTEFTKNRTAWKFNKVRQTHLLKMMYSKSSMPKRQFRRMLDYLDGLKGAARQRVIDEAQRIRSMTETEEGKEEEDQNDSIKTRRKRAKKILKALAES